MTACPPDQRRPLRRVCDEEVSLAQHVSHDTAVNDRLSWRAAETLGRPLSGRLHRNATITNAYTHVIYACSLELYKLIKKYIKQDAGM